MSAEDQDLFGTMIRVENKDIFIDVRRNDNGTYLKLSERKGKLRKTVLIPASGIKKLQDALEEASAAVSGNKGTAKSGKATSAPAVAVPANSASSSEPSHTIFVGDLSWETTEDELKNHFKPAGRVVAAQILRKARRGKLLSTGNGLVQFSTPNDANNAIAKLNGTSLGGREITCRIDKKNTVLDGTLEEPLSPSSEKAKDRVAVPNSIYVGNLSWSTSDETLAAHFRNVGTVKSANVRKNKSGRSLGNAVVEFQDGSAVTAAIETLHDSELDGRKISVREYFEK